MPGRDLGPGPRQDNIKLPFDPWPKLAQPDPGVYLTLPVSGTVADGGLCKVIPTFNSGYKMEAIVELLGTIMESLADGGKEDAEGAGRAFDLAGAASGGGGTCCPSTVDPYAWLALIGGIAMATYFLRVAIVVKMPTGRKKRDVREEIEDPKLDAVYFKGRNVKLSNP